MSLFAGLDHDGSEFNRRHCASTHVSVHRDHRCQLLFGGAFKRITIEILFLLSQFYKTADDLVDLDDWILKGKVAQKAGKDRIEEGGNTNNKRMRVEYPMVIVLTTMDSTDSRAKINGKDKSYNG